MGKYEGFLIATDFDGTFAERGGVSPENQQAVRYFQSEGGLFTIASGRSPDFLVTKREEFIPNAPIISINGTMVNDPVDLHVIREFTLDETAADAIIDICANTPVQFLMLHGRDREGTNILLKPVEGRWFNAPITPPEKLREAIEAVPRPWYKVVFVQDAKDTPVTAGYARSRWGSAYQFDCSWPMGLELHSMESGKGECLQTLRDAVGIPDLTIVGAGDFENDVSLLRMADIGYAVGNALDSVKAAADRITVPCAGHAIARIIEDLANEKK